MQLQELFYGWNSFNSTESIRRCILVVPFRSQQKSQGHLRLKTLVILTIFSMFLSCLSGSEQRPRKIFCVQKILASYMTKEMVKILSLVR